MNRFLQTKRYHCPKCGVSYLHDQAHLHTVSECPARPKPRRASKPTAIRPALLTERIDEAKRPWVNA